MTVHAAERDRNPEKDQEYRFPFTPERLAAALQGAAREIALNLDPKSETYWVDKKLDGSYVTSADMISHEYLSDELPHIFEALVVSEEGIPSYEERKRHSSVWIVDPIDNTAAIIEDQPQNSSINVALVQNGQPVVGMVHYIGAQRGYLAIKDVGTFVVRRDQIIPYKKEDSKEPLKFVAYKPHLSEMTSETSALLQALDVSDEDLVFRHKLPNRFRALIEGEADVYIEPRPICEWDVVHAFAFINVSGGQCLNLETGEPIEFNSETLKVPPFILTRPGVDATALLSKLRKQ